MLNLMALAAVSLARLRAPQGVSELIEKLGSNQVEERDEATCSFKRVGKGALPDLACAAFDLDPEVAGRARYLIRLIRNRESFTVQLLRAFPGLDDRLASGSDHDWTEAFLAATNPWEGWIASGVSLSNKDIEPLIPQAVRAASTPSEKSAICSAVQGWDLRSAIPDTVGYLADADDGVRVAASSMLRGLKARETIPRIIELLHHPDGGVRLRAVDLLGWLEDPAKFPAEGTIRAITKLLADPEGGVRGIAVASLAKLEGTHAIPKVLLVLRLDPAPWVRLQAGRALVEVQPKEAVPVILKLLKDKDPVVREGAFEILRSLGISPIA